MTTIDWIAVAVIGFFAFAGWRRGLIASALSLAGLVGGAYAGSRAAPHLLHGGAASQWTPVAGLVGAIVGATIGQTLAALAGAVVRGGLRLTPLRFLDSLGGIVLDEAVPPRRLLHLLARIDPFPSIAGPSAPTVPPSASVLHNAVIRRAMPSV